MVRCEGIIDGRKRRGRVCGGSFGMFWFGYEFKVVVEGRCLVGGRLYRFGWGLGEEKVKKYKLGVINI